MLGIHKLGRTMHRWSNAEDHAFRRKNDPIIAGSITCVAAGTLTAAAVAGGFIATSTAIIVTAVATVAIALIAKMVTEYNINSETIRSGKNFLGDILLGAIPLTMIGGMGVFMAKAMQLENARQAKFISCDCNKITQIVQDAVKSLTTKVEQAH